LTLSDVTFLSAATTPAVPITSALVAGSSYQIKFKFDPAPVQSTGPNLITPDNLEIKYSVNSGSTIIFSLSAVGVYSLDDGYFLSHAFELPRKSDQPNSIGISQGDTSPTFLLNFSINKPPCFKLLKALLNLLDFIVTTGTFLDWSDQSF
jgi:hypothetical protein